jgi:RNA recognition motif-containing protein
MTGMVGLHSQSTLLVDGFPLSYSADDLTRIFTAYGEVVWARVVRDRMGISLGFGYVAMASASEADAAIEALHGKCLAERVIQVVHAEAPPLPRRA